MTADPIGRLRAALAASAACGCRFPGAHGVRDDDIRATLDALDASEREAERLRECMRMAGLAAFLRAGDPCEVAEHLRGVIESYDQAARRAESERDQARRAALEEAIDAAKSWACPVVRILPSRVELAQREGAENAQAAIVAALRALLDAPGLEREDRG